jgi:hypothetical protein
MFKDLAKEWNVELTNEENKWLMQKAIDLIMSIKKPLSQDLEGKMVVVKSGHSSNIIGEVLKVNRASFIFQSDNFIGELPNWKFVKEL